MSADSAVYAICETCGLDLQTPDVAAEHRRSTVPAGGGTSHGTRVVNPTPAELAASRVGRIVSNALESAMEDIDGLVQRGRLTEAQASEELTWFPDFADAWTEWLADGVR